MYIHRHQVTSIAIMVTLYIQRHQVTSNAIRLHPSPSLLHVHPSPSGYIHQLHPGTVTANVVRMHYVLANKQMTANTQYFIYPYIHIFIYLYYYLMYMHV